MNYAFADRLDGISGSAIRAIFSLLGDPEMISFAGGNPSPLSFPKEDLSSIASELLLSSGETILQYGGTLGTNGLLHTVKNLFEKEGLSPKDNELIILSGSSQGIELMCKSFINPGDVVLVEDPSFLGALQTFKMYQAKLVGVKMDENGIVLDDLEEKLKTYRPKFLYTIPTFQNPTGRTLPESRRKRVCELCTAHNAIVLEDDPYAALRYEGTPQKSIKSFDTEHMVVKLMSFSKTISPGLRVGAAYAPEEIIQKFNLGKQGMDVHTSNLSQELVNRYVSLGLLTNRIEQNKALYSGKLSFMYDLACEYFPSGTQIVKPLGGMFLWAELPDHLNATELFAEAVKRNVAYVPGTHFYADGGHHNTLRLNFTMVDKPAIEKGMKTLGALLQEKES